ncbi:MAG: hypothetical protein JOZ92_04360 [Candidatus Dormibacteraeota bacterium]|nr:hypothetical protein [Candidatus Dormibacteraeota bacterium]
MIAVIVVVVLVGIIVGAALMWAVRLPPTRPRPRSRHRGDTFTTVDRQLRERRK